MNESIFTDNPGNGNLRFAVMKHPNTEWNVNTDTLLNIEISGSEWDELFLNIIKLPRISSKKLRDETYDEFDDRLKAKFQETLSKKGYNMLGRIWSLYDDVIYFPSEVQDLKEECLDLQQKPKESKELVILEKFIYSCKQAIEKESGLRLLSD